MNRYVFDVSVVTGLMLMAAAFGQMGVFFGALACGAFAVPIAYDLCLAFTEEEK